MSDIFPRLNIHLNNAAGVSAPAATRSIEAIKQDVIAQLSKFSLGTPLRAEVIAKLADGSVIANVANIPLRLALPQQAKIGDQLRLTLLQTYPRLTFSVDGKQAVAVFDAQNQGPESILAKPLAPNERGSQQASHEPKQAPVQSDTAAFIPQQASIKAGSNKELLANIDGRFKNALQSYQAAVSTAEASSQIELSPVGKILASVLSEPVKPGLKLSIGNATPLADDITARANPSRLTQRIETQLVQRMEYSGLFYESHLAQWAEGKREIADIQKEPQSAIALDVEATVLTDTHESQHAALAQLVHQQLDILDQGRLTWMGNLTESVDLQILIEPVKDESNAPSPEPENDDNRSWRTTLALNFPHLGLVEVTINLKGHASDVQCKVASPDIVQILHQHAKELIKAFDESGNQLHSMKVSSK